MSAARIVIVGALVCLFNVAMTSAASAKCESNRGNDATEEFCFGPAGEAMKAAKNLDNAVGVSLNPRFVGAALKIECTGVELEEGRLEPPSKMSMRAIRFKNCGTGEAKCKVNGEEIKTKPLDAEAGSLKEVGEQAVEARLVPEAGVIWAIITMEGGECPAAGKIGVSGGAKITLPHGQTQSVQQEVNINTGAGELKVGAAEMKLSATIVLESEAKEKWSFD